MFTDTENSFSPEVEFFTRSLVMPPSWGDKVSTRTRTKTRTRTRTRTRTITLRVRQVPRSSASSTVLTSIGQRSPEYLQGGDYREAGEDRRARG